MFLTKLRLLLACPLLIKTISSFFLKFSFDIIFIDDLVNIFFHLDCLNFFLPLFIIFHLVFQLCEQVLLHICFLSIHLQHRKFVKFSLFCELFSVFPLKHYIYLFFSYLLLFNLLSFLKSCCSFFIEIFDILNLCSSFSCLINFLHNSCLFVI